MGAIVVEKVFVVNCVQGYCYFSHRGNEETTGQGLIRVQQAVRGGQGFETRQVRIPRVFNWYIELYCPLAWPLPPLVSTPSLHRKPEEQFQKWNQPITSSMEYGWPKLGGKFGGMVVNANLAAERASARPRKTFPINSSPETRFQEQLLKANKYAGGLAAHW